MDISSGWCVRTVGNGGTCMPWSEIAIMLVLVVAVLAVALVPLLVSSRRTSAASAAAARANRHATLGAVTGATLLVAVLSGFAFTALIAPAMADGRVVAVLPAVAGLCLVLAQVLTQVTWPRPAGMLREADLTRRSRADVVPVGAHRLLVAWSTSLVIALAMFTALAAGPRTVAGGTGAERVTWGPYPGLYYSAPVAVAAVLMVAATEFALRLVVLRPAVPGVSREWDLHLRRRSARHLVGGAQLALAVMLTGMLVLAGVGHRWIGQVTLGSILLTVAAVVPVIALTAQLRVPHRRTRHPFVRSGTEGAAR
ncbi:hypothetical protein [Cellulomonas denverensis]|uniref:hypothetical protein n=1 Tax=Cellulomonas denverensis TaxID=264297 RepID=UPI001A49B6D7|nr:hypothetical protein [Cellulomonas denverensis]GIG24157.1 hypothetical protein Cde04nite_04010 [Cellulomonas denverensis]